MTLIPRQQASGRSIAPFTAVNGARVAAPPERPAGTPEAEPKPNLSEPEADAPARRIAELEGMLAAAREQLAKAREAAFAEGCEEGLAQAAQRDDERLTLLREAIERASNDFVAQIELQSNLAVLIARAALQKAFGAHWARAEMVEAVIRHDALELAAGSVIRIRVSQEDFPEAATLTALARARNVEVVADAELASGACLFDLTLGTVDASIPVQARAADELLAGFLPAMEAA